MNASEMPKAISGRATGVLFFAGFGSLWLCMALSAMHRLNLVTGAGVVIVLAALVIPAVWLLRQISRTPTGMEDTELERQINRTFGRVNAIQWIAIPVAVVLLSVLNQPALIVPAIATIVGLHLFPLARLFRYPMHYVTGALLVLWSAGTVFLIRRESIPSVGALGAAIILLLSATYTLIYALRAARRVSTA